MPKSKADERKPVIITFKRKDKRSTKADKQEILQESVTSEVRFLTSNDFSKQARAVGSGEELSAIGYDVNRYQAPLLMANLTQSEIDKLKKNKDIARIEEDGKMYALDDAGPLAQTTPTGVSQVKAPAAWPSSQGEGIKVFICDTGIDSDHPDLVANLRTGKSFVTNESSTEDYHGHGTHCAGTVAAAMNDIGVVGVAPYAYLYPVKVLASNGSGNWSWLIAALDWIMDKKGARVASMSLGGGGAPQALGDMCEAAYDDGVLLVAAAGNSGHGADTVGFPARYPHVMSISAVDDSDIIANFSSTGPSVEVCAPGVQVLSTTRGGGYGRMSGTSMACPHVSGVAALAWGSHRGANNKQIRWILNTFVDKVGDQDPEKYGKGRVDANTAAFYIGNAPEFVI
ncbi:MAG: S8 family peptidase [Pseudomonadota bacterium]